MANNSFSLATGRWTRPKIYGTVLALILLAMCIGALSYLATLSSGYSRDDAIIVAGPSLGAAVLPPITVLAASVAAAYFLLRNPEGRMTKYIVLLALVSWTIVSIIFIFAMLTSLDEMEFGRTVSPLAYINASSLWAGNALSWLFYKLIFRKKTV